MAVNILLGSLLVLATIERYLLIRRHDQERSSEAMRASQERSELAARVQGLRVPVLPLDAPTTKEEVEEPDETGMVGQVVHLREGENAGS